MIAGRSPDARVLKAVQGLTGVTVSGTVEDVRPYLWGAKISIVPIRIGSGTRLKIYECMAAGVPVVSTTVGAEGLSYEDGTDIVIEDDPSSFADACVRLLSEDAARRSIANNALEKMQGMNSWEAASREFEAILESIGCGPSEPCRFIDRKIAVAMPAAGAVARGSSLSHFVPSPGKISRNCKGCHFQ